jgi:hypothetical protein
LREFAPPGQLNRSTARNMKLTLATLLSLFLLSVANGQAAKRLNVFNLPCRELGTLPFSDEKSELKELEPSGIDGVEVQRKFYKLADEQIVFLGACDPNETKVVIENRHYGYAGAVRDFTSYAVNGRVFAYRFTYYVVMTKNGFITTRAGAAGDIYYIDQTGNGSFDRYRGAMPLRFLPDWLKGR